MPSLTPRQHRAMEAADHGHGTLGIPKSVAHEFVQADKMEHPHNDGPHPIHEKTSAEVNPNRKDHVATPHAVGTVHTIVGGIPHGKHKHLVHDRRDKPEEHHHTLAPAHETNDGNIHSSRYD